MASRLRTVVLLGLLSVLLVALGGALAPQQLSLFVVLALAMNVGAYFFSDRIVLAMSRARELSPTEAPSVFRIVAELTSRAGLPMPRIYLVPDDQPNAFATGRNPRHAVVAVTEGILQLLDERELRGVLAHELSHVRNRDVLVSTIAAALASIIAYAAQAIGWFGPRRDDDEGVSPLAAFALALVAPLAATLIQLGISRSREFLADESGARLSRDPEALARALLKLEQTAHAVPAAAAPATASLYIVNPFGGARTLVRWFSTHPPIEERVARLRAMTV